MSNETKRRNAREIKRGKRKEKRQGMTNEVVNEKMRERRECEVIGADSQSPACTGMLP